MISLLVQILPLAIGAAVSPVALTITVLILAQRNRPLAKACAFAVGELVPLVVVGVPGVLAAHSTLRPHTAGGSARSAYFDVACGATLAALVAIELLRGRRAEGRDADDDDSSADATPAPEDQKRPWRYVLTGIGAMFVNFSTLVIFVPAVKTIGLSAERLPAKLVALGLLIAVTLSLTLVPISVYTLSPARASRVLTPVGDWFKVHTRSISLGLLVVFSAFLLVKGLRGI